MRPRGAKMKELAYQILHFLLQLEQAIFLFHDYVGSTRFIRFS